MLGDSLRDACNGEGDREELEDKLPVYPPKMLVLAFASIC